MVLLYIFIVSLYSNMTHAKLHACMQACKWHKHAYYMHSPCRKQQLGLTELALTLQTLTLISRPSRSLAYYNAHPKTPFSECGDYAVFRYCPYQHLPAGECEPSCLPECLARQNCRAPNNQGECECQYGLARSGTGCMMVSMCPSKSFSDWLGWVTCNDVNLSL